MTKRQREMLLRPQDFDPREADAARLAAAEFMEKLPTTADGVYIYPGMTVYLMTDRTDGKHRMMELVANNLCDNTPFCWYSSVEAAEEAFCSKYPELKARCSNG